MTGPTPRTRTVDDVAGPYANFLLPIPDVGPGVCNVCHSAVYDGYSTCYPCMQARRELWDRVADAVSFVALAPKGEQMARDLYTYKRDTVPIELRRPRLIGLAAVLWKWLAQHESCVARAAGVARFDVVTSVPSTRDRMTTHPLAELVSGVVGGTRDRYEELLTVRRTDLGLRDQSADRFGHARPDRNVSAGGGRHLDHRRPRAVSQRRAEGHWGNRRRGRCTRAMVRPRLQGKQAVARRSPGDVGLGRLHASPMTDRPGLSGAGRCETQLVRPRPRGAVRTSGLPNKTEC